MGRRRGRSRQADTYVVNSSSVVQIYQLIKRGGLRETGTAAEAGGYFPMTGAPYGIHLTTFLNPLGMPCWKPPYGTLSSYDLKTGKLLWNEPFGQVQKWGFYMPKSWGSVTIGAPVITAIGPDLHRRLDGFAGARHRPEDAARCCGSSLVDAPAVAMPAVYDYKGKQYVVFAAGGNSILTPKVSDEIAAFALPN